MARAINLCINTRIPDCITEIVIEEGVLRTNQGLNFLAEISNRWVIITDEKVGSLWGSTLIATLNEGNFESLLLTVPQGESSKSRDSKESLEEQISQMGWMRDTGIIALGGGVVNDLAGFVAATYCRGIPWISIPTTLLGMVDASLGGKVGINTSKGKNLIGAFHFPRYIIIDAETLRSLSLSEKLNGLSEIIKYALISSTELFDLLSEKQSLDNIDNKWIEKSCKIKMDIVVQDPHENGLRRILNFGHTIGHAIETASEYSVPHGTAIALGMIAESYLSALMGFCPQKSVKAIEALFKSYKFPLQIDPAVTVEKCLEIMLRDKKAFSSKPRCVLLQDIGKVIPFDGDYCCEVPKVYWQKTLLWMLSKWQTR